MHKNEFEGRAERRRDSVPSGSVRTLDVGDGDKIGHENDVNRPYKAISSTSNDILSQYLLEVHDLVI